MRNVTVFAVTTIAGPPSALVALLGVAALAGASGCSGGVPGTGAEEVGTTEGAITDNSSGLAYQTDCKNAGVPLPPPWGTANIGPGKSWTAKGTFSDSFTGQDGGNIWYASMSGGVCVINAHLEAGAFDVICQGTNGHACFWEGAQSENPPAGSIQVLENNWSPFGSIVTHGGQGTATSFCTGCHAGGNAFITHYNPGSSPPDALDLTAVPGWMPKTYYNPLTSAGSVQNPGPDPFAYYPASTSGCLTCHAKGGTGGQFPLLLTAGLGGFCQILAEVTNRPGSRAGMPPGNMCTPDVDCAAQTDPFVLAMLSNCSTVTSVTSGANSPVAFEGYSSTSPYSGWWDHAMADTYSGGTHKILELDNFFYCGSSTCEYQGWSENNYTSQLNTNFRTTMWLKGDGTNGSNLTMAATDPSGVIWESGPGSGGHHNVLSHSPVLAAGSPSAYVRNDGYNTIVFRGQDNYIYESYWDGASTWYTNQLPGQGRAAQGDPIGYNRGSSSSVVYKCAPTLLCEERLVYGSWYFRTIQTSAYIKYVAMPFKRDYAEERTVFYTSTDGVHAVSDNSEPWFGTTTDSLIYADTEITSAPIPFNDQSGGVSVVYISSGYGWSFVNQVTNPSNNSGWGGWTLLSSASELFVGDPAAYVATGPWLNTILFRNSAGALYQLQWDNSSNWYAESTIPIY
jgi:hypothetical protein